MFNDKYQLRDILDYSSIIYYEIHNEINLYDLIETKPVMI